MRRRFPRSIKAMMGFSASAELPSRSLDSASRRNLLSGGAATIAYAFVPASAVRFAETATAEIFTAKERHCLEAMVSRIIPTDANGPGALEAGCAVYIESALRDAYRSQKSAYSAGLAALDSLAIARRGKLLAALDLAEQDQILTNFERNIRVGEYTDSAAFFEQVRRHTLEGMFCDPSYGGNARFVGWDLIGYPGLRMYVTPDLQQMNVSLARSRVSAEQLMHGSR
jgi:gluconate 2-dehydrogenase gamma chain